MTVQSLFATGLAAIAMGVFAGPAIANSDLEKKADHPPMDEYDDASRGRLIDIIREANNDPAPVKPAPVEKEDCVGSWPHYDCRPE